MKKLLLALFTFSGLFAQNEPNLLLANKEQNMNVGGSINSSFSAKDAFGNTYIVGTFSNTADFDPSATEANSTSIGSSDLFIAAYDSNGNFLAVRNIGGTGTVTPAAVAISGGFIYLTGSYINTIDFDPSAGVSNLTSTSTGSIFLAKYNLNGSFISCKSIDRDGTNSFDITDMKVFNNEVVLTGRFSSTIDVDPSTNTFFLTSNNSFDAFVAKYDSNFQLLGAISFGGTSWDQANSVAVDSSGNIIVVGSYLGTVDFDPSSNTSTLTSSGFSRNQHDFLVKFNNNLTFQWVKDIGARNGFLDFNIFSKLVIDSSNNILVTGTYAMTSDFDPSSAEVNLTASGRDVYLAKYDTDGNYVWVKRIGGTTGDRANSITIDTSNNIYISGTFNGTVDFDPNAGVANLSSSSGANFFAKYDTNGNYIYANNTGFFIGSLLTDNNNALVLSGSFSGTQDFDPSAGTANLSSVATNSYLAKYTANGTYIFAKPIGGDKPSNTVFNFIATDATSNIYRVGTLSAVTDLDPSAAIFNLSSLAAPGIFIAKYSTNGSSLVWAKSISAALGSLVTIGITNTDSNGNTYIVGKFFGTVDFDPAATTANLTSNNNLILDTFIVKYDSSGNYLWAKQLSGNYNAEAKKMLFDASGNFYFAGRISGTTPMDFDPSVAVASYTPQGNSDIVFTKYSPEGNYIWAKGIGGTGATLTQTHIDLKGDSLYLGGFFFGSVKFNPATNDLIAAVGRTGFIAKYDLDGNYQLAYPVLNSTTNDSNSILNVTAGEMGNFYLFTSLRGTADFDLLPTSTSLITSPTIGSGQTTTFVISKYSSNGALLWAKALNQNSNGSILDDAAVHSYVNNNSLILAFQFTNGGLDLDPSPTDFVVNTTRRNIFVSKYNINTGDFIWGNKIDGDYTATLNSTNLDSNGNLLLSGSFQGTADFDFSSGVNNLTSNSPFNQDRFYVKYNSNTTLSIDENNIKDSIVIYPNPATSVLNIQTESTLTAVKIADIQGKTVIKSKPSKTIDVSTLTKGVYFIEVQSLDRVFKQKFIK